MENRKNYPSDSQREFDETYITSTEIGKSLGVKRSTILNARVRGLLPDPIEINGVRTFIWKRQELVPYLDSWRISLASRRGELK